MGHSKNEFTILNDYLYQGGFVNTIGYLFFCFQQNTMDKILITGGTGLVGSHLTTLLRSKGHEVVMLSRKAGEHKGIKLYEWNPTKGTIDIKAFDGVNKIVHLAGAGVADHRWTKNYKQQIIDSRVLSTQLLVDTIRNHNLTPEVLVSTSAIGIYGNQVRGEADEQSEPGISFLADVCKQWEKPLQNNSYRTAIIRVGVVLAKESGFIPQVAAPIKWGVGAALGSGKQLMSWIHIDDLCHMYECALNQSNISGVYNAVAPLPVSNTEITKQMALRLKRPLILPNVPEFTLRMLFGEITDTLLANQHIKPTRFTQAGFNYQYPTLNLALDNLL
jgi:uncharacterized protein (TIGR01777 family)